MTSPEPAPREPPHRRADVALFAGLPLPILDELARASRLWRCPARQVLWNEGDPGEALLVLEVGQFRISHFTSTDRGEATRCRSCRAGP